MSVGLQKLTSAILRRPLAPHELTAQLTPQSDMPVLAHFGIPAIASDDWLLTITGLVERPLKLSYADFRQLPRRTLEACFECAGNPLDPTVAQRRVANVAWGGAPLRHLLGIAGIQQGAEYLWSFGVDGGMFAGYFSEAYGKYIPLNRALEDDVLLADTVNGEPLTDEHGFPVRLIVPGYYGTNSVKWLSQIVVSDRRLEGLFTTQLYTDPVADASGSKPVWEISPESVIVSPANGEELIAGCDYEIAGWAWAALPVAQVEISDDDGITWRSAKVDSRRQMEWQRFTTLWEPQRGNHTLMSRALANEGDIQPSYGARNAIYCVTVHVK